MFKMKAEVEEGQNATKARVTSAMKGYSIISVRLYLIQ